MHYSFSVFLNASKRVDIYLSALFSDFSRSYIQKLIDSWQVSVNSEVINKNIKIKPRDEIRLYIKVEWTDLKPENIFLDIVYEDKDILVINKDAWINVHPVPGNSWRTWTLVNAILYHCKNKLPCINWVERPWIVHRLDKDTSWVMMIAKTDYMMNYLSKTIKDREVDKYYIAIVSWIMKDKNFKIESYIWRDANDRNKMTTINPINPKIALSYGETIWYIDNKYSVLKVKIETWRTHQIRVHLASIWYPIIWDKVYWNKSLNKEIIGRYGLERQALHASDLYLKLYNKDFHFNAPLKDDILFIFNKLD